MKYKVGDKVRVISILKAGEKYGDKKFTKCMEKYRGEVVTISKVYCNMYFIKEDYEGWYWTDEMFEPVEEMSAKFKLRCAEVSCVKTVQSTGLDVTHIANVLNIVQRIPTKYLKSSNSGRKTMRRKRLRQSAP